MKNKFSNISKVNAYNNNNNIDNVIKQTEEQKAINNSIVIQQEEVVLQKKEEKSIDTSKNSVLNNLTSKPKIKTTSFTLTEDNIKFLDKISKQKNINKSMLLNAIIDDIKKSVKL